MGHLHLSLFGPPRIQHEKEPARFATRKTVALLAYLAVEEGLHTREKLAALLWPDKDAGAGRTNLRNALARLRRPLRHKGQKAHLIVQRNALGFNRDAPFTGDWHQLRRAVTGAEVELEPLVAAYRGDFLEGFVLGNAPEFDAWARQRREEAHRQMELIFQRLAQQQADAGRLNAALATAEQWLAHNPLSEVAARHLMRLHLARGDRTAALSVHGQIRQVLKRELDVAPEAATTELARRVRAADFESETRKEGEKSPAHRDFTLPFSGRAQQYRQLIAAWKAARAGRPGVVVLSGEAGVGKSRLASEFLSWAVAQGAHVWHGRAYEMGGRLPYQPLVDALRPFVDGTNAPEDLLADVWLSELSRLLPELRERYPDLAEPAGNERLARPRLYEAVARLGQAAGSLLVFVDDLQWADTATLDLLHFAARRWHENDAPILLLLARRVEDSKRGGWVDALARVTRLKRLSLESLTREHVETVIRSLVDEPSATAAVRFAHWLFEETGGQPFYLAETLEALLERSWLVRRDAASGDFQLDLSPAVAGNEIHPALRGFLPAGIHRVIRARLERLDRPAFELVSAGAVLGQRFTLEQLQYIAAMTKARALSALDDLLRLRMLIQSGAGSAVGYQIQEPSYAFAHDKIRDVAYTEAGDDRRRLFHRRAFELLRHRAAPPAALAEHATHGGMPAAAVSYNIRAGDEAMALFAVRDAINYYQRARQVASEQSGDSLSNEDRRHLLQRLGRAYDIVGDLANAEGVYRLLVDMVRLEDDKQAEALARNKVATILAFQHRHEEAQTLLEETMTLAEESGDARALAETHWNMGQLSLYGGDPANMATHATRALELARQTGDSELIARCLNSLAYNARNQGRAEAAIQYGREALARYQTLGDLALEADCHGVLGQAQLLAGRAKAALRHARTALELSREIESRHGIGVALPTVVMALVELGRYEEAASAAATLQAAVEPTEDLFETMMVRAVQGIPHRALLDMERLLEGGKEGVARAAEAEEGKVPFELDALLALDVAEAHALRADWEAAHPYALRAPDLVGVGLFMLVHVRWWLHVETLLRAGERPRAERILSQLEQAAEHARRYQVPWRRSLATVARWDNRLAKAVDHLEAASEACAAMGLMGPHWEVLAELSQLQMHAGRGEAARALRHRARSIVTELADGMENEEARRRFCARTATRIADDETDDS